MKILETNISSTLAVLSCCLVPGSAARRLPFTCCAAGTRVNGFNRGLDKSDLARLVDQFNQTLAGTKTSRGQSIPMLRLPANYEFGKSFQAQDLRLSRMFVYRERYKLMLMGEIFNLLNIANIGGYSSNVRDTANFGQPQSRADQVFGSGGQGLFNWRRE